MVEAEARATITAEPVRVDPSLIIYPRAAPPIVPTPPPILPEWRSLIVNIEATGFNPLEHRIISIGVQDPLFPDENPVIIFRDSEKEMIELLFMLIKEVGYKEIIGYGLSFDFRFILVKAMKYNLDFKEFYDCDLYDVMQVIAQGKREFVYFPQKSLKLSDVADFFWGYPKPFTDLEMLKYYAAGDYNKVIVFTSEQVTRILALYLLFKRLSETSIVTPAFGGVSSSSIISEPTPTFGESKLTIPEAHLPETRSFSCPLCLAEVSIPLSEPAPKCKICNTQMVPK